METKTYSIPNISCIHCVNRVEQALLAIEGVDFAEADLVAHTVTVDLEEPANDQIIRQALESIGYPATL
ncbi:MAG: heavy-metal-associated domain-containing protein [Chloroflexi bacterium]|jgi:copper chaperone CopZ|nr:heavy-metal-associated domain-containing protein [Chloroflexota bacterium]